MEQKKKKQEEQERAEAVRQLAGYLGLSEERVTTLLGSRVRGVGEFSQKGEFHFTPSKETGPRLERIKTTRQGSSLTKTLRDQPRLRMTLLSSPGSDDPEADLIDEANSLLSALPSKKQVDCHGRTIMETEGLHIRADGRTRQLVCTLCVPLKKDMDYVTALANMMSLVFKAVTLNKEKIKKFEPKSSKEK